MDQPKVAVLLPSAYRPKWLERCLVSLRDAKGVKPDLIVTSPFSDDADSLAVCQRFNTTVVPRQPDEYQRGAVHGWNLCYSYAAGYDFVMDCGDDVVFRDYWLDEVLAAARDFGRTPVLIGLNDGITDLNEYAAHWMASADFLSSLVGGCAYPPLYKTWWCDREVTDIAVREKCYIPCPAARIDHLHYALGLSDKDETYLRAIPNYEADEKLYRQRKEQGFPITWKSLVG